MDAEGAEEWTVAGRRGKKGPTNSSRRGGAQLKQHAQPAAQPQQQLPGWGNPEEAACGRQADGSAARIDRVSSHPSPAASSSFSCVDPVGCSGASQAEDGRGGSGGTAQGGQRGGGRRPGRRRGEDDSVEARVQRLAGWVEACRAEVRLCPTYLNLVRAMAQTEAHLAQCLGSTRHCCSTCGTGCASSARGDGDGCSTAAQEAVVQHGGGADAGTAGQRSSTAHTGTGTAAATGSAGRTASAMCPEMPAAASAADATAATASGTQSAVEDAGSTAPGQRPAALSEAAEAGTGTAATSRSAGRAGTASCPELPETASIAEATAASSGTRTAKATAPGQPPLGSQPARSDDSAEAVSGSSVGADAGPGGTAATAAAAAPSCNSHHQDSQICLDGTVSSSSDAPARLPEASSSCPPSSPSPWAHVEQLVVYGLGSVEDSRTSRYQLALALLLRDLLPGLTRPPLLFDPAFSDADVLLLQGLGLEVLTVNEQGRRRCTRPTLFFMPHCEHLLYESLLSHNVAEGLLHHVCMLGNSLGRYHDQWTTLKRSHAAGRPTGLLQLVQDGCVQEVEVHMGQAPDPGAFNNMALHLFPPRRG